MSADTHLILATSDEIARAFGEGASPDLTGLATCFHPALAPTHLERLASLLEAGDDALAPIEVTLVPGAVEARVLSDEMVERLAEAGADAAVTADAWASAAAVDREWCGQVLTDLVELASKSIAEGRRIYALIGS